MMLSPGLLPPDNTLPLPPVAAGLNHKSFVTELNQFQELACGVVDINRTEAQQRATQYYTQLTFQIKEESWVRVLRKGRSAPEGFRIPNRKLACKWAGLFRFAGMFKGPLAKLQKVDKAGRSPKSSSLTLRKSACINSGPSMRDTEALFSAQENWWILEKTSQRHQQERRWRDEAEEPRQPVLGSRRCSVPEEPNYWNPPPPENVPTLNSSLENQLHAPPHLQWSKPCCQGTGAGNLIHKLFFPRILAVWLTLP